MLMSFSDENWHFSRLVNSLNPFAKNPPHLSKHCFLLRLRYRNVFGTGIWYRIRISPGKSNKDHSKNFQCLHTGDIVFHLFVNSDYDWNCLGFKRVKKVQKREILTS